MASDAVRSSTELQIGRCCCETGRQRYRIPRNVRIPYEVSYDSNNIEAALAVAADEEQEEPQEEPDDTDAGETETVWNDEGDVLGDEIDDDVWIVDEEVTDTDGAGAESEDDSSSDRLLVPKVAVWRLNLTALSQRHNIYFVVFRNEIHASRPRSCVTHTLPSIPDLVMKPGASAQGVRAGGHIDRAFPHQVNHVIIGDFGYEEVLLLAYDDGDVIGYYTRQIEDELMRREQVDSMATAASVRPFFHENVGISAWGLAVHKKSRIIAVGSNLREATVFAPALAGKNKSRHASAFPRLYRHLVKGESGKFVQIYQQNEESEESPEDLLKEREGNWKITLRTGSDGHNIPNLAFSDDEHGYADKVVAVDVLGNIWIMNIWTGTPHVKIPGVHRSTQPMGWGVAVLPERSFMPTMTENFEESLGVPADESEFVRSHEAGAWLDISRGVKSEWRASPLHPWLRFHPSSLGPNLPGIRQLLGFNDRTRFFEILGWFGGRSRAPTDTSFQHVRSSGGPKESSLDEDSRRQSQSQSQSQSKSKMFLKDGSSILRTYETDVELRSFEYNGVNLMFEHAIRQIVPTPQMHPTFRFLHQRLSTILHIPELSLVIAASMCGRVALITLTRPKNEIRMMSQGEFHKLKRGFKIEAVLPNRKDEDRGVRPACPLLGVAAAPLPFAGIPDTAVGPRYRLMIHYWDLRILSYELSRSTESLGVQ